MIQKLTTDTLESAVRLHMRVLGHTLNSQIGSGFLKKLYSVISKSADNSSGYVYIKDAEIFGFISFCLDHATLEKEIMNAFSMSEKASIAAKLLVRPSLWPMFIRQHRFGNYLRNNLDQPYASILTLGVSPAAQGQGIGGQLLHVVKAAARNKNIKELFVDTEETNVKAATFYQKNGFCPVAVTHGNIVLKCSL